MAFPRAVLTPCAQQSWSAARSSILQVFISIQSLIMVENPYFTEVSTLPRAPRLPPPTKLTPRARPARF